MVRPKLEIPPVEALHPEHVLQELAAEEPLVSIDGQNVSFIPTKLSLEIDAPIDTAVEMKNLYLVTNTILATLLARSKPGKPHPQLLGYIKQAADILSKYHAITEQIQDGVSMQKMKAMQAMFEMNPALSDQFKVQFLKEMRARIAALEAKK